MTSVSELAFQPNSGHTESSQVQWYQWMFSNEYRNIWLEETSRATVLCCHSQPHCRAFSWTNLAPSKSYVKVFAFPMDRLYQNPSVHPPSMLEVFLQFSHHIDFRGIIAFLLSYHLQRGCAPAAFIDDICNGLVPKADKIKSKSPHVRYQ